MNTQIGAIKSSGISLLAAVLTLHGSPVLADGLGPIFPVQALGDQQLALRPGGTAAIADASYEWVFSHTYIHDTFVTQIPFEQTNQSIFQGYSPAEGGPLVSPDVAVNETNGVSVCANYYVLVSDEGAYYQLNLFLFDTNGTPTTGITNVYDYALSRSTAYPPIVRADMNRSGRTAVVYFDETAKFQLPFFEEYIYVQLLNSDGSFAGSGARVNQRPIAYWPVVAATPEGGAVAAWEDATVGEYSYDPGHDIYARIVDAQGNPVGKEFRVNTDDSGRHTDAEIAMAPDGVFAIVWTRSSSDVDGVYLQRFNPDGSRRGPQLRVSPYSGADPQVAMAADGRFVVAWQGRDDDGSGIFGQRFLADGSFYGSALWVNEGATNSQTNPLLGLADDGTFLVKWQEATNHFARWISWDATNQTQILGPRVQSISPALPASEMVSNVTVVFDRAMNPATCGVNSVQIIDPLGRPVTVDTIQAVDDRSFLVWFAEQHLAGTYKLTVSPTVADSLGNLLDEDGDTIGGEPGADAFRGQFVLNSSEKASFPVAESFENGPDALVGWRFDSSVANTSQITTNTAPHNGMRHLHLDGGPQSATLAIRQSGGIPTNCFLSFWAKGNYATLDVDLSTDGQDWRTILETVPPYQPIEYIEYILDLDQAAATNGLVLGPDLFIRFRSSSVYLDDVLVRAGGPPFGPKLVATVPTQWAGTNASLNTIELTFSQAIDPATLSDDDLSLTDPLGNPIGPVIVAPVTGSQNTQFLLLFPDQTTRGDYQLIVGPNVANVDGHLMNQDGDAGNGTPLDRSISLTTFAPQPRAGQPGPIVFEETFENWPPTPTDWSFQIYPNGGVGLSTYEPRRGVHGLLVGANGGDTSTAAHTGTATLALDLSGQVGETNLFLEFWVRDAGLGTALFYVDLSDDAQTWRQVLYAVPPSSYTRYELDLDQLLQTNGLSVLNPVYLRFRCVIPTSPYSQVGMAAELDDIRVLTGNPAQMVPPFIAAQPQSVFALPGTNVAFTVSATGTEPLSYQWLFNGAVLPGETNATLSLTDVQPLNGGGYRLVVSNAFGEEFSALAILGGVNDDFANRIPIVGDNATVRGSNQYATLEPGEPDYGSYNRSVWWSWTAPGTGRAVISLAGSSFNTLLRVFTGSSVSNLTAVGTDTTSVSFVATAGIEYQIMVEGYIYGNPAGTIQLSLQFSTHWPTIMAQPQNQTATEGFGAAFSVTAMGDPPLAYQWQFKGADLAGETNASMLLTNVLLSQGGNYQVVVSNSYGSEISALAVLTVIPHNDYFTNRYLLTGSSLVVTGLNINSTTEPGEPDYGSGNYNRSVWWSWTAPGTGRAVVSLAGSSFNTLLRVFTGSSVSNLTEVGTDTTTVAFVATAGTEYQIMVEGYRYGNPAGTIQLSLQFSTHWPTIMAQPQNQTATEGFGAAFSVTAMGDPSLAYQWQFKGADLAGETNASLLLTNVLLSQAGNYQVVVSNSYGSETSALATLTVIPHNDYFTNRYVLAGSSLVVTGLNLNATTEPGEPGYGGAYNRSVWWSWTAPGTGRAVISLAGSSFNTLLRVFTGTSVSNLTEVGTDTTTVAFVATAGTEYQIMVEGYRYGNPAGTIQLSLQFSTHWPTIMAQPQNQTATEGFGAAFSVTAMGDPSLAYQWQFKGADLAGETNASLLLTNVLLSQAGNYQVVVSNSYGSETSALATLTVIPHNDYFTNRYVLAGSSLVVTGLNLNATTEPGEPGYGGAYNRSVWWSWTAPGTGRAVISVAGSSFNTLLRVFTGTSVTNLTEVGTDTTSVSFVAAAGTEYQIMVEGYIYGNPAGTIQLSLQFSTHWPTIMAQPQNQTATEGFGAAFSVTAMGDSPLAYQWQFKGADLAGETNASLLLTNVLLSQAGNYQVVVTNSYGSETSALATLSVIPHNDYFTNRYVLAGSSLVVTGLNLNATTEPGEPDYGSGNYNRSVWWSWMAPGTGRAVISVAGSSFNTLLRVFTGSSVSNLTEVGTDTTSISFVATAGTEYQIMVEGYKYGNPAGTIQLSLQFSEDNPPAPPQLLHPGMVGNTFTFSFNTVSGRTYVLEFKTDLGGSTWTPLGSMAGDGELKTLSDSAASGPQRFYRVRVE